jgi:UDP-glucose 4-epimerase
MEKRIHRKGDGSEVRSYINVKDAALASVELISEDYKNKYIIINGSQTMPVKNILNMVKEILGNQVKIKYSNEKYKFHYKTTPYSFRPRVATKYVLINYHDLGQGILDCIYDVYKKLNQSSDRDRINIELPEVGEID